MKKFLSVLLAVCLLAGCLPLSAGAEKQFTINGVTVSQSSGTSLYNCSTYASQILQKIWNGYKNGTLGSSPWSYNSKWNMLKGKSAADRKITEAHVKTYIQQAPLGSRIRICAASDTTTNANDNSAQGHTQVLVEKNNSAGTFTVLQAGSGKAETTTYTYNGYATGHYVKNRGYLYFYYICDLSSFGGGVVPTPTPAPHTTHTKGTFQFFEAAHPHKNVYKCSVCGENFYDGTTHGYYEKCTTCNPPVKPSNLSINIDKSSYTVGETVKITPSATNVSYYAISIWDGGAFNKGNRVYSNGNFTGSISFTPTKAGTYSIRVDAINSAGMINGDKVFQVKEQTYYLDANGYLNGSVVENIRGYGTVDVYVNGNKVADDVADYYTAWPAGMTYEFKDMKPAAGYEYNGIHSGSRSGTIIATTRTEFVFSKINTSSIASAAKEEAYNGHTYRYYSTPITWYAAKQFCEKQGGHLVTITSAGENNFVKSLLSADYNWMGYTDLAQEGTWKWITGESSSYTNWNTGEPNNSVWNDEGAENYGMIKSDGTWNDSASYGKYPFVCELDFVEEDIKVEEGEIPLDPTPENSFIDVPNGAYFAEAVNWAVDKGITAGTSSNTFSPNAICTRAQAVTFLWRAAGSPEPSGGSTKFVDVASGQYYTKAVQWAVEKGITGGTSATTFSPNDKCTRAQIVTFQYRMHNSPSVSGVSPFADVPPTLYYANAVAWAVENGITSGTSASTFSPHNDCSRGQIVTFLYRDMN